MLELEGMEMQIQILHRLSVTGICSEDNEVTKASLLAGVCFPLGMYWGQSF